VDGLPAHSFETLLSELASRARVTYELAREDSELTFRQVPEPTPLQARAYALDSDVPSSRKLNLMLTLWDSVEYSLGARGTSV
jgi:hypothetical protein